mmetsp:Transcript_17805/g.41084  ORF Transcript_17805/g.41084 Transcript_17805/m.41084 type:complete len:215 (+) Transcript_17805:1005-1649(+)
MILNLPTTAMFATTAAAFSPVVAASSANGSKDSELLINDSGRLLDPQNANVVYSLENWDFGAEYFQDGEAKQLTNKDRRRELQSSARQKKKASVDDVDLGVLRGTRSTGSSRRVEESASESPTFGPTSSVYDPNGTATLTFYPTSATPRPTDDDTPDQTPPEDDDTGDGPPPPIGEFDCSTCESRPVIPKDANFQQLVRNCYPNDRNICICKFA